MSKKAIYIHGMGGSANEAEFYRDIFAGYDVVGMEYTSGDPMSAKEEFPALFESLCGDSSEVILIANSIGAFFAMHALKNKHIDRAFFISPVADMERLILGMMAAANISEEELCRKGEIPLQNGEVLSWRYLCYVREHPIVRAFPIDIICGDEDILTPLPVMKDLAEKLGASLTVMTGGEHWFHTDEQMDFLNNSIKAML